MARDPVCRCRDGDPNVVCDACYQHSCAAGNFMCEDARTAGTIIVGGGQR